VVSIIRLLETRDAQDAASTRLFVLARLALLSPKSIKEVGMLGSNWAIRFTTFAMGCASLSTLTFAQAKHDHNTVVVPIIDGTKNPELIPDLVAYRLYLVTVGELPTAKAEDTERQQAHLAKVGLIKEDAAAVVKIANDFKKQYRALIDDYNAHLDAQRIDPVAFSMFMLKRDALVASAMSSLRNNLTQEGFAGFDKHIQAEKSHMQTQEGQQ
jgi:hypothetical protein